MFCSGPNRRHSCTVAAATEAYVITICPASRRHHSGQNVAAGPFLPPPSTSSTFSPPPPTTCPNLPVPSGRVRTSVRPMRKISTTANPPTIDIRNVSIRQR
ncbi:uncharacterized protein CANTADRAFT_236091 [Suhomyces tanzawaensis NRRL Y-17324]|uniref:Uncharacterized protein n=1 Tax=Suhomyces tanzawaensis NRRL Y-17324 TaxID=984487 RepID=A0A1E4SHH4_9ASCO|nr:uncharacterized protein CANTADRAFT_236091 [Suhomyces tanzawaensis NRRL Y-17324]ODV78872.1 hypothetical protein CANTADRAFT_236091 [Suhomyces tanzawaensis NRRL Y-17324]